ncbi:class I SAM-dependent methyltransferase [Sulfurospirillum diekertiae]|uniref:Class I SAM-dependent methyltransferase n=1 Tax=Sulfurospirillum diekertiae TaxID=1854492 RepID=A0A6G9VVJ8_9BACT|nr:class I SAM-dependent methyltransferase [Sulfurospirillum diekertiae]QIR76971.1 class I SAM-dependent methyltransferase [Sulfurospirillum diekertiae]QIR79587.1 class I SAM-dependent methyltransferase [Sulfurospirillum diekertiae]
MSSNIALWNSFSKQYPQQDDASINKDAHYIIEWIESHGISFENYSLLDIGCGTGAFSIPLAQKKAHITALDISYDMLKIVHDKSVECDVGAFITLQHDSWSTFSRAQTFDIVLASMTPAISSTYDIDCMLQATKSLGIFVGWKRYENNTLLDLLLLAHNAPEHYSNRSVEVKEFLHTLEKASIAYNVHYFPTTWKRAYTYEEAKNYAYKQLLNRQIFPQEEKIDAILHDIMVDNRIVSENKSIKGVVLFSKCALLKEFSLVC